MLTSQFQWVDGHLSSAFQAEIQATLEYVSICLNRKYKNSNMCIFSDSHAALSALKSYTCTSKLVWECSLLFHELCTDNTDNTVNLYWVPRHCRGIEKADELARMGSTEKCSELFCRVSICSLKMELKNWKQSTMITNWTRTAMAGQSKQFIKPHASDTQKVTTFVEKRSVYIYRTIHRVLFSQMSDKTNGKS